MNLNFKKAINEEMQKEHSYIYYQQSDLDNYLSSATSSDVKQHVNLFRDYLLANDLCEVQE